MVSSTFYSDLINWKVKEMKNCYLNCWKKKRVKKNLREWIGCFFLFKLMSPCKAQS